MKKIILSMIGLLAATAFAPQASAVPAFARQTGMACTACHTQHFPVLNSFGRAFKADGFTMMGSQGVVEGEHLSIPDTLNLGVLLKVRYQKTNGDAPGETKGTTTNSGQWQFPDEYAFFIGGRVADTGAMKVGVMMENALGGTDAGIAAGLRVPVVIDMDALKLSVIPFTTDGLGPFYGYSEASAGVVRSIRWAEHRKEISAHLYTGLGSNAATGLAFVAKADMGYINVTKYSPLFASNFAQASTAIHAAFTPTIAGFDTIISVESLSGESFDGLNKTATEGSGFTAEAHGELAGMEAGFYLQNATVKEGSFTNDKVQAAELTATTVGADISVIPHVLSVGAALRSAEVGGVSDNATTLTAVYDLAQNVAVVLNHSMYEDAAMQSHGGDTLTTFMLEAAW
jgi:hypothetical protein